MKLKILLKIPSKSSLPNVFPGTIKKTVSNYRLIVS